MVAPVQIRAATPADAADLADVYRHHVLHGTATFEEEPPGAAEMAARLEGVQANGWPWLVAHTDGIVAGYAYARQLNERAGYRYSCENSIYIRHDHVGRGIGTALLVALIDAAMGCGFRRMFAVIGDSANLASRVLHSRQGFSDAGTLREAGFKFGRPIDVVYMQRTLMEFP